jgi:hypothetical protein
MGAKHDKAEKKKKGKGQTEGKNCSSAKVLPAFFFFFLPCRPFGQGCCYACLGL